MLTAAVGVVGVAEGELDWTKPITIINQSSCRERGFFFYFLLLSPCGKRCFAERNFGKDTFSTERRVGERDQLLRQLSARSACSSTLVFLKLRRREEQKERFILMYCFSPYI